MASLHGVSVIISAWRLPRTADEAASRLGAPSLPPSSPIVSVSAAAWGGLSRGPWSGRRQVGGRRGERTSIRIHIITHGTPASPARWNAPRHPKTWQHPEGSKARTKVRRRHRLAVWSTGVDGFTREMAAPGGSGRWRVSGGGTGVRRLRRRRRRRTRRGRRRRRTSSRLRREEQGHDKADEGRGGHAGRWRRTNGAERTCSSSGATR